MGSQSQEPVVGMPRADPQTQRTWATGICYLRKKRLEKVQRIVSKTKAGKNKIDQLCASQIDY